MFHPVLELTHHDERKVDRATGSEDVVARGTYRVLVKEEGSDVGIEDYRSEKGTRSSARGSVGVLGRLLVGRPAEVTSSLGGDACLAFQFPLPQELFSLR